MSVAWSAPGRSVRPIEFSKSTSPENSALSSIAKVTWPGLWPGVETTSTSKPASCRRSPPSSGCSASQGSTVPQAGGKNVPVSARIVSSARGQYTGAPVARAIAATAPMWSKWVWVSRIASGSTPSSSHGRLQPRRLVAGIDEQRAVGALAADQVAVLLDRARR